MPWSGTQASAKQKVTFYDLDWRHHKKNLASLVIGFTSAPMSPIKFTLDRSDTRNDWRYLIFFIRCKLTICSGVTQPWFSPLVYLAPCCPQNLYSPAEGWAIKQGVGSKDHSSRRMYWRVSLSDLPPGWEVRRPTCLLTPSPLEEEEKKGRGSGAGKLEGNAPTSRYCGRSRPSA